MIVISGRSTHHFLQIAQKMKRYKFAKMMPGINNPASAGIHQLFGLVYGANTPEIPMNAIPRVAGFINK